MSAAVYEFISGHLNFGELSAAVSAAVHRFISGHLNFDELCKFMSGVLNLSKLFAPAGAAVCGFMLGDTTFGELRNWFCLARLDACRATCSLCRGFAMGNI